MVARRRTRKLQVNEKDPEYETRMQDAIKSVAGGASKAQAAMKYQVARQTLSGRCKGKHVSRQESHRKVQLLAPEEEDVLVEWSTLASAAAQPWAPSDIHAHVKAISGSHPGKNWHQRFIRRHPTLALRKASGLDPTRAKNFNLAVITDYFEQRQKELLDVYGPIPPEHEWNMDEKGIQMGGGRKNNQKKFLCPRDSNERYRIRSDNLELSTVLECISAAGVATPPAFVLSEGPLPDVRDLPDDSVGSIMTSPKGWSDRELCENWFEEVFIPFANSKRVCGDKPIVLNLDGHDSHETTAMKRLGQKHDIVIFCFPSKCTHKLQPLDVAVFSSVQRAWSNHCEQRLAEGVAIDRYNVIHEYLKIRHVITPDLMKAAFAKTGIYPFNPAVFTNKDFGPSMASSTAVHVPSTYPPETPSSPPATDGDDSNYDPDYEMGGFREGFDSDSDCGDIVPMDEDSETGFESDLGLGGGNGNVSPFFSSDHVQVSPLQISPLPPPPPLDFTFLPPMTTADFEQCGSDPNPNTEPSLPAAIAITPLPFPTHRMTRSESRSRSQSTEAVLSNPLLNIPLTDDWLRNVPDLISEIQSLRTALEMTKAELRAANAHCTVMKRALAGANTKIENLTKKKNRGSTKVKARFITLRRLQDKFEEEDAERQERERIAAEKEAEKQADAIARNARITRDAVLKTFENPLSSYRKKDDLLAIAGALEISTIGTVADLTARIKDHLGAHSELSNNSRFAGLFHTGRRRIDHTSSPSQTQHPLM